MGQLIDLNRRTIADADLPATVATDAEVAAAVAQRMPINPTHVEFGLAPQNIIDFHGGTQMVDFDVRVMVSGGIGQTGRGDISVQANNFSLVGGTSLSLNGGAAIKRLLMADFIINPPSVPAGGVADISLSLPGTVGGDAIIFTPVSNPYNGLWTFNVKAFAATNVVLVFFHNVYSTALDLPPFTAKVVALGF